MLGVPVIFSSENLELVVEKEDREERLKIPRAVFFEQNGQVFFMPEIYGPNLNTDAVGTGIFIYIGGCVQEREIISILQYHLEHVAKIEGPRVKGLSHNGKDVVPEVVGKINEYIRDHA